ncbi:MULTISPECIES: YEATS-associated helix-containing protein [unclassified Chryseobacterium]|uniref:YEATS-associated helix-containing protein n=1 Tax=unclassified Chryseobacterium TaxID=2593645 RepID=UPI000D33F474|nr:MULTISPECIES: YEATS-associated helix-containing protein [unclassified Chryseobacterium]PTT72589.1 hypothetical protein DBR25_14300 [Chryseobacterium sp. HMWF001]PVV50410.1 hypothetical protein DD829_22360 [Chryseobacterium sp. HMWF035]
MKTSLYIAYDPSIKIILIILICGLTGGIGNSLRGVGCNWILLIKNIFLGIIAASTVPLFLNLVSSDILKNIYDKENLHLVNYLIFSGFCMIAAFSSLNFLNTISGRVLQNLKEEIRELKSYNESLKETHKRLDNNITAITPISNEKGSIDNQSMEKFKNPDFVEIISSIKNEQNKFKPLDIIKNEVNLDNREIEKKIEILKENNLVREVVSGEGEKAVALTEEAEQILK